jgi:hypothetical protein
MTTAPEAAVSPSPPDKELKRGYRFWGLIVTVILVVEGAGAIRGSHWYKQHVLAHHAWATIPWTTISGMVGHLEELFPATAVFVVAVIAPAAFYSLAPLPPTPPKADRTDLGRIYFGDAPRKRLQWYSALAVFAASALAGFLAVQFLDDDFQRAYCIYGALFVLGIVVPSLLLLAHMEPGFTSLFVTIGALRRRSDWLARLVTIALTAGLGILAIHLAFYPWPDITKEPVQYAGLTAREARDKAVHTVKASPQGATLFYSTQARNVVDNRQAWTIFFRSSDPNNPGCAVNVDNDHPVDARSCGIG